MKSIGKLASVLNHFLTNFRKTQHNDIMLLGKLMSRQNQQLPILDNISDAEFKVFSQMGDDGIIQYLIHKINITDKTFIEFGVENYVESNTRFLLKQDNWSGLIIDGSRKAIDYILSDPICHQHDLKAVCSFITAENINDIFDAQGIRGEVGLLSIDIDGNDYWVWKAINIVTPTIVVAEYNSVFGKSRAITVPYKKDFVRAKEHYSHLYFGASLKAFCILAHEKGYSFVGSNLAGNNAYFVRTDKLNGLKTFTAEDGYVESKFRESRNKDMKLNYLGGANRLAVLKGLPVYNIETDQIEEL